MRRARLAAPTIALVATIAAMLVAAAPVGAGGVSFDAKMAALDGTIIKHQ